MKRLLLLSALVMTMSLSATAQTKKLDVFDQIESVTLSNHATMLPVDFKLTYENGKTFVYQNEAKDVLTFLFSGKDFVSLTVKNPALADAHSYWYDDVTIKETGQVLKLFSYKNRLINKNVDAFGNPQWVFYSVKTANKALLNLKI